MYEVIGISFTDLVDLFFRSLGLAFGITTLIYFATIYLSKND
jgi:hypothetical protein